MIRWPAIGGAVLALAVPSVARAQTVIHGGLEFGRAEHRVIDQGALVASSGTVLGGTISIVRNRFAIRGYAVGGNLTSVPASALESHHLAEAQLLAGFQPRPWITLQAGLTMRNFSNPLARQHWVMWRAGAEARVPLGFDGLTAALGGYWLPAVSVSGLPAPDIAAAAAIGLEWRRSGWGAGASYVLERYDFPERSGTQRLEQVSALRVRILTWWPRRSVTPTR